MQKQNDLAINLMNLFEPTTYTQFDEGYFVNRPRMSGYYYIFKKITRPKFCLIVNTGKNDRYSTNMVKLRDYVFIVFNAPSIEEFVGNLADKYFTTLMDIIDNEVQKKNERNLPYGYYIDENGELKVDIKKANEVRRIYDLYIDLGSVREIAAQLRTNFSHIREVLHDYQEYAQMKDKIVSPAKLKQVGELMAKNVRGGAVAKRSIEDEVREARARRKQLNKNSQQQLEN